MAPIALQLIFLLSIADSLQAAKILVATGNPLDNSVKTEIIDLADESSTCEALGEYPIQVTHASGGLINGSQPLICGGYNDGGDSIISECYMAGGATSDPVAKLLIPRKYSAAVALNSHQLWVTGGFDGSILASTEMVDVLASPPTVAQGPELPAPMSGHCIVQLNHTAVLVIGGFPNLTKTFFFDASAKIWTDGPELNYERIYFGCGLIQMAGDSMVVASGGDVSPHTTEFLHLGSTNGLKWTAGPDLPKPLTRFQMVNFEDGVIAIGGYIHDVHSNSLFKLVCSNGWRCQWKEMSQKLRVARSDFVAIMIPDDEKAKCPNDVNEVRLGRADSLQHPQWLALSLLLLSKLVMS